MHIYGDLTTKPHSLVRSQNDDDHHHDHHCIYRFTAMEFVATPDEQAAVVASAGPGAKLLTFMEHRENMVRMFKGPRALPARWARMGTQVTSLSDTAQVGEFFTFQASLHCIYSFRSEGRLQYTVAPSSSVCAQHSEHAQLSAHRDTLLVQIKYYTPASMNSAKL